MSTPQDPAPWDDHREDFADMALHGGLVDLIVPGTGPAEWESFWAALRSGPFELQSFRDGAPIPLPETAEWFMKERSVAGITVSVRTGTVTANCHFFGGDLELDLDPREITGPRAFEAVLALMRFISAALGMPVLATPEGGGPERAFIRVLPNGASGAISDGA